MSAPRITVFTPMFNRFELLKRTYRSICAQTFRDFEWLIIDDGSTDDTTDIIRTWQRASLFPIRFIRQRHQGKHIAHNNAIAHAKGELFAVLDSDDTLVPNALERLLFHWDAIPVSHHHQYSGVTCLCMDEDSRVIGRPFPFLVLD